MGMIEQLQAVLGRQNKLNKALYVYYGSGTPIAPPRNYTNDLVGGYTESEAIYSIVNKIASTASSVPVEVVDVDNKVLEVDWVDKLLKYANEDTTFKELVFNYYVYLLSIGNSYIYSPLVSTGQRVEMWTMPSDLVEIISGPFWEPIKGYRIIEGDQQIMFDKKDVLHGKLFNPRYSNGSWLYGISPIAVAVEMIRQIESGSKRMSMMAEEGGPPYIISAQVPEGLTAQQQELLEDTYKRKYKGLDNVNEPMLSGTPLKVDTLGATAADMELIQSSEYAWRVLANVFGVDSILFNDKSASAYNNVEQAYKDFINNTIIPLNDSFANKLSRFLFPAGEARIRFNYSDVEVLNDAKNERMIALDKVMFLTEDEKREMFGYEPLNRVQDGQE